MTTTPHHARKHRRRPLRERAWWCMREMAAFGLDDLLLTVATGAERAAADNLRRYIRSLERHGVLAHLRQVRDDNERRWRLARDLGPSAPVLRRSTDARSGPELIDTNTQTRIEAPATAPDTSQP
jgi:hypothetical protein